jgi:ribosomal protein S18 acetylase RimI-like enzyme
MYRLGELNRLQQNFPYDDELHSMFVALCSMKEQVIGFVDVDARPSTRRIDPPRPYLSDLAVHPDHRRKGIARSLVQACEEQTRQMGKERLYIRVEIDNAPAVRMYKGMDYESHPHEIFGVNDNTVLLCKMLVEPSNQRNATGDAIDYVV